jgi:hypothetical protein
MFAVPGLAHIPPAVPAAPSTYPPAAYPACPAPSLSDFTRRRFSYKPHLLLDTAAGSANLQARPPSRKEAGKQARLEYAGKHPEPREDPIFQAIPGMSARTQTRLEKIARILQSNDKAIDSVLEHIRVLNELVHRNDAPQ